MKGRSQKKFSKKFIGVGRKMGDNSRRTKEKFLTKGSDKICGESLGGYIYKYGDQVGMW